MTVYINGTTGISGVDGSAATPALQGADTNTGISFGTDTVTINTGGVARVTTDASGNVGIGTSVNSVFDAIASARPLLVQSGSSSTTVAGSSNSITISNSDTTTGNSSQLNFAAITGANANQYSTAVISSIHGARTNGQYPSGTLVFSVAGGSNTAPAERMRIDSSGNLLVGTTTAGGGLFKVKPTSADICLGVASATAISGAITLNAINNNNTANIPFDIRCSAFHVSTGIVAGAGTNALRFNTGNQQFTYDTSSARYKDNIRDSVYGLPHVLQMRSAQFEYKDSGRTDVGLIAEEVEPIIPELVGKDKDGNPDSVSYDRMVSVLVKAIQELKSELDSVKAELATLKGAA